MLYFSLATIAFALLLAGFTQRFRRVGLHAALMSAGMALDLTLVLALEVTKGAVATALEHQLTAVQGVHVAASALAVALYVPVFAMGFVRLYRASAANVALRVWHRRLGYVALFFRAVGFLFMFSMLGRS